MKQETLLRTGGLTRVKSRRHEGKTCGTDHRRSLVAAGVLCGTLLLPAWYAAAAPYQDAVRNLGPNFYYQLNEMSTAGGVIDSMGNAAPGSYNGDYVNGPPMVGGPGPMEVFGGVQVPGVGGAANLAHYSNNAGHIIAGPSTAYGANAMTVALFLKAGPAEGGDRIFTNNLADPTKSFQIVTANDGLVVAVDPNDTGFNAERTLFVEDNSGPDRRLIDGNAGWFHVVAATQGATGPERAANIRVWINGIDRTSNLQPNVTGWGINTDFAKIGGRRDDPADSTTHSGAQDEVAVWLNRVLTDTEVATLWAAARRPSTAGLSGWWPFDGNVSDLSGRGLQSSVLGAPTFDADKPAGLSGQSIRFNAGEADGVRVAAASALDLDEFTLGYFINLKGVPQGSNGLERLTARANYAFETAIGDAHVVGGTTSPTGITLSYFQGGWHVTQVPVPADGWMHIAWRSTAAEMQLFFNGSLAYTGPPVPAERARGFMNFGTAFNNVEGYEGLMDDAFLWDGSLTALDIAAIAAAGVGGYSGITTDSDGDGLPDWWEIQNGLNAGDNGSVSPGNGPAADPDSDGLTNAQEFARSTKAKDADTDDDGLQDGNEVTRGTNPLVADTDADGLADGNEITRGTNPLVADTDNDGVNDGDEVAAGSNPLDPLSGPPPSTFLVLHLMLDGNAQDSSPLANNGQLLNNPGFVNDSPLGGGQAMALPNGGGTNNVGVQVPGNSSLSSNTFTLTYWVKPTAMQEGAGLERLTSRSSDLFETAIGDRAAVGGAADPLTLSYFQGGWQSSGVGLVLDEWAHVAWVNRGPGAQDLTLFVDGQLVFTGVGVPAGRPGSGLMNIGTRHNQVEGFEGLMDDVRLYRAPLKDSDIAAIAMAAPPLPLDFTSIVRAPNGSSVTLTIQSRPGKTYAVDFSTALNAAGQQGGWIELTDAVTSGGAQTVYVDSVASNLPRAFYRVRDVTP